jgi:galactonate dehydratase
MWSVYDTVDPASLSELASAVTERGYDALKVVFVPFTGYVSGPEQRRLAGSLMITLREAVGPDVGIMVDFHGRPESVAAAVHGHEKVALAHFP